MFKKCTWRCAIWQRINLWLTKYTVMCRSLHYSKLSAFLRYLFLTHLMARCVQNKIGCTPSPVLEKQLVFYTCMEVWTLRSILFKSCRYAVETPCNIFHLILIGIIQKSKNGMKCHGPLSHVHTRDISWARGIDPVYSCVCVFALCPCKCVS